jgi:CBS-domain-containing membrane protein
MARTRLDETDGLTVADITHSQFKALSATATVGDVQEWFAASDSRNMALFEAEGRYEGRVLRGDLDAADLDEAAVAYAQRGATVAPHEPASRGEELALATPARRVPVVDGEGRLVGIVAITHDLKAFCGT